MFGLMMLVFHVLKGLGKPVNALKRLRASMIFYFQSR
jgi:hypothetical protein